MQCQSLSESWEGENALITVKANQPINNYIHARRVMRRHLFLSFTPRFVNRVLPIITEACYSAKDQYYLSSMRTICRRSSCTSGPSGLSRLGGIDQHPHLLVVHLCSHLLLLVLAVHTINVSSRSASPQINEFIVTHINRKVPTGL